MGPVTTKCVRLAAILLDSANGELFPQAELLLYFVSCAQNVEEWIAPALQRREVTLADRSPSGQW